MEPGSGKIIINDSSVEVIRAHNDVEVVVSDSAIESWVQARDMAKVYLNNCAFDRNLLNTTENGEIFINGEKFVA